MKNYKEIMESWHDKAQVRTKAPISVSIQSLASGHLFSTELVPVSAHQSVLAKGPDAVQKLKAWALAGYLLKTEKVEIDLVNEAIEIIISEIPDIPNAMKLDAFKVYTDESYHVVMMIEIIRELQQLLAFDLIPNISYNDFDLAVYRTPTIAKIVEEINGLSTKYRKLGIICSAIVTETLITANLKQAADKKLVPEVAEMLLDHARDEAKHHAFFAGFANLYLPTLDSEARLVIEGLIPKVLFLFLCPDLTSVRGHLSKIGFSCNEAMKIIQQSYDLENIKKKVVQSSVGTRKLFDDESIQITKSLSRFLEDLSWANYPNFRQENHNETLD